MQYRAPLDGLRALCAGAVFFFHASYGRGGGFIGVDVFFVLSGYLITRILLEDINQTGTVLGVEVVPARRCRSVTVDVPAAQQRLLEEAPRQLGQQQRQPDTDRVRSQLCHQR